MSPGAHLVIAPVLLPLATAVAMLLVGDRHRRWNAAINVASSAACLALALSLLQGASGAPHVFGTYLPSNWDVPFGIVLVADRLSALMLVLSAALTLSAAVYATAAWHRAGVHFHPLLQVQLMGLNGVFLTADLFNLFVFFEVMLAASYGLLMHGSGRTRVRSGLAFVAVNLMASTLFLIGVAVLYGVTGTLGMADIARRIPDVAEADRALLHSGAAILAVAFFIKAAAWPLGFWLPRAYTAASAPVAALFVIMTKVGVYAVLRLWTLFFPEGSGASSLMGAEVLLAMGLVTLGFGMVGLMATHGVGRLAAFSIVVSAGTLLSATAFARVELTAAALLYLAISTLAGAALFLVAELAERSRLMEPMMTLADLERDLPPSLDQLESGHANLDDEEGVIVGRAIPAAMAFLGLAFILCALLVAGLPPLAGFVAKLAMVAALVPADGAAEGVGAAGWAFAAMVLASGLAAMVAMSRAGIRHFWAPQDRPAPRLAVIEGLPIAALLAACVALTWAAEPALAYARATARSLHAPAGYIEAVMSARVVPGPTRAEKATAK